MAGIKKIRRQGRIPLKNRPIKEATKVALKKMPTNLPLLELSMCLEINIMPSGITDAPKKPIKTLAVKSR